MVKENRPLDPTTPETDDFVAGEVVSRRDAVLGLMAERDRPYVAEWLDDSNDGPLIFNILFRLSDPNIDEKNFWLAYHGLPKPGDKLFAKLLAKIPDRDVYIPLPCGVDMHIKFYEKDHALNFKASANSAHWMLR